MAVKIIRQPEVTAEYLAAKKIKDDIDVWVKNEKNIYTWANPNTKWFMESVFKTLTKSASQSVLKFNLIGLCGNAGVGKDSALGAFSCYMHEPYVQRLSFAEPIRVIGQLFGFSPEQFVDRKLKETDDEYWGISPRKFMQMVGSEMFRHVWRDDAWVKCLERRILMMKDNKDASPILQQLHTVFITDVRFPNEAKMIKDLGGTVVRIKRPGFDKEGENLHESEKLVSSIPYDVCIDNTVESAGFWAAKFTKELAIYFNKEAFFH